MVKRSYKFLFAGERVTRVNPIFRRFHEIKPVDPAPLSVNLVTSRSYRTGTDDLRPTQTTGFASGSLTVFAGFAGLDISSPRRSASRVSCAAKG